MVKPLGSKIEVLLIILISITKMYLAMNFIYHEKIPLNED